MRKTKGQAKRRWWIAVMIFCCIFAAGRIKSADTVLADAAYDYIIPVSYTHLDVYKRQDKDNVTVTATVTNTGDTYSGKEVVEVYFSARCV